MSESQGSNSAERSADSTNTDVGKYFPRIKALMPKAITEAPRARLLSTIESSPVFPDWYLKARPIDRGYLKELIDEHWRLRGELDEVFKDLQHDIHGFAEPLLKTALQEQYNESASPSELQLRLYVPSNILSVIDTNASTIRRSTLLESALHNFEQDETRDKAFRSGSAVLREDVRGNLQEVADITPQQFAMLCRRLDIGGQYQTHLQSTLKPADAAAHRRLQQRSIASDKSALKLAAMTAYLKGDIGLYAYDRIGELIDGKNDIQLYGRPMQNHRLSLMGCRLTGIVLFSAVGDPSEIQKAIEALTPPMLKLWMEFSRRVPIVPGQEFEAYKILKAFFANGPKGLVEEMLRRDDIYRQSRLSGNLIVYVPEDPDHPLKEYASFTDFMKELVIQLRDSDYQAFFSRFVAQKDKALFFTRLNERFKRITWRQREPLDMGPWWRETPTENPDAQPLTNPVTDDVWQWLFRERRDKAIADARLIAVPTDDEDASARWKRLTGYLEIAWNVFNFGAMLVPGLGQAMLGIMAAQLLAELAEGIEDWSKGDVEEGAAHINSVLINSAQLALMSLGHVLPTGLTPVKPSALIDSLRPVELPNGKTRLIKPDLASYEHRLTLPGNAVTDDFGLITHGERQVLPLEGKHYVVMEDPVTGQHRLQHPERADAYQLAVSNNGAGAWHSEFEAPVEWDRAKLLRRLGPAVDDFSDEVLERIRLVSGVEENALRRLHVEGEAPPPLLVDALKRFRAYADAEKSSAQILAGRIPGELSAQVPGFVTRLRGWPESKALVLEADASVGSQSISFGNAEASVADTIHLTPADIRAGRLPAKLVDALSEAQLQDFLGSETPRDRSSRVAELRRRIASQAQDSKKSVFDGLYKARETSTDARINLLRRDFPTLSTSVAKAMLDDASAAELAKLSEGRRVPLRLRELARQSEHGVRLTRAFEGLYLDELSSLDGDRLVLHTLESWPHWPKDVRIEMRKFSSSGALLDSVGPSDAAVRKVLVLREDGRYEAYDAEALHLHGADDLYAALLHALPDAERKALGYEINQGAQLRQAVRAAPLSHDKLSAILLENPLRKPAYDPQIMRLRGGMRGYQWRTADPDLLRVRTRSLFPEFSDAEVQAFLGGSDDAADQRLRALEAEFDQFNNAMRHWVDEPAQAWRLTPQGVNEWNARNDIYKKLRQCWQRTGPAGVDVPGILRPQALNFDGVALGGFLTTMPELTANFDHVTELSLANAGMRSDQVGFLRPFRQLRQLNMAANHLTEFPEAIGNLRMLTTLILHDNYIRLTEAGVTHLRGLTRLNLLRLSNNPLQLPPDISRMPEMQALTLDHTQLDTWPTGLFGQPRPRHIYLNLQFNVLTRIPEVAPGSFRAELLARTFFTRTPEWISPQNLERMKTYIESLGLDPDRPYPPRGVLDNAEWQEGMTDKDWFAKTQAWDLVEDEHGSAPFFNEIRRLTESFDFKAQDRSYRAALTAKVWRMLEAMAENTELREKIFAEASSTTNCVDGGTQLFNAMGVEVLVHEAYALSNPGLVEAELLLLARGKSRLDELGRIARERVAERLRAGERFSRPDTPGGIDEVEVHLAYMTDLAERLDLPWQARGMQFRAISGVSKDMIEAARQRVLALEEGDLLAQRILEQPIWERFLEKTYRAEFDALKLRLADAEDEAVFQAIKDLEKSLTRQALGRAKLDKVNT